MMPGRLYVVATPIGNLQDITLRALDTLRSVDRIAAEDTRHTRQLLAHFDIHKPLVSLHEHNETEKIQTILGYLAQGESLALVSDAGTPCISDPGCLLLQALLKEPYEVVPIPGPSALTAALSATGACPNGFLFLGFLPSKGKARAQQLSWIKDSFVPAVLYESPHRLGKTLSDLAEVCHNPTLTLCRELTKVYEEHVTGSALEMLSRFAQPKGEFVLIVQPPPPGRKTVTEEEVLALFARCQAQGLGHKKAAEEVARQTGLSKKQAYQYGFGVYKKDSFA